MPKLVRQYVSRLVPGNRRFLATLLIAVAVVNSATLGYDASVMNNLNELPSYTDYFHLNTATRGLNTATAWMGNLFACALIQPVTDILGRKNGILISALICFVGTILQAAAQNTAMFVVARFIVGVGSELSSAAAPALLGELVPAASRGWILGLFFSCFYVGSLIVSIITYGSQHMQSTWAWRLPSLLQFVPSIVAITLLPFVPESPRWLVNKGKFEHAREVLIIMEGDSDPSSAKAAASFSEIEVSIAMEKELYPRNPWIELFSTPANRKRLAILVSFGIMLEMFGNFVVSYYLTDILSQAGITKTKTKTQITVILNCWSFAVAAVGSFTLDRLGRRRQTLFSIFGMIVSLFILGGLINRYGTSDDKSGIYGAIAAIFFFQGFYAFAITPMTSVYPTEVSQYKLRAAGTAIFRFVECGFGLMASFAMSYAMANLGWKFYIINACIDIIFITVVYFLFIETAGLTLEEITRKFEGTSLTRGAVETTTSVSVVKVSISGLKQLQ